MIIDETLQISVELDLSANYIHDMQPDVAFELFNYLDGSDINPLISIDKYMAVDIIAFLQKHFKI